MNQLLGVLDADRITIAKIHNGTFDHTNSHQMKLSMIYEVVSNGTKSNKKEIQNIPLKSIKKEIELGSTVSYRKFDETDLEYTVNSYIDKVDITTKYYKLLAVNKDNRLKLLMYLQLIFTTEINRQLFKLNYLSDIKMKRLYLGSV